MDHWARVGRAVSSQHTAACRRVEAALAGDLDTNDLNLEEGIVFDAEVSAAMEEGLGRVDYGDALAARGIMMVALDAGRVGPSSPRPCSRIGPNSTLSTPR